MAEMKRFERRKSIAGVLQPGDGTRYEMVAVELRDCVEVIVQNDAFFDKIVFLAKEEVAYETFRGSATDPWTIKAAAEMRDMLLKE